MENIKQRFTKIIKTQGLLAALQMLTPLEVHVKILSKVQFRGSTEDVCFLYKLAAGDVQMLPPKDLEAFLFQLLAERGSDLKVKCEVVKQEGTVFCGVFISRPKEPAAHDSVQL
jgi:hypothetical protein